MAQNETLKVACVQMTSGPVVADNLEAAEEMIRDAAGQGAQMVFTPENTCRILSPQNEKSEKLPVEARHPGLPLFAGLAEELGIWIICGSMKVKLAGQALPTNRCYVFSDTGDISAFYDKIHLYDADLPTGERHRESKVVMPGNKAVVTETPWGELGLSICYDLRFACLYRMLAQNGAKILSVPAAFTVPTGKAHWEVLLRARAIETGSFVVAAAQTGEHDGGRLTYGHSMIVSPWGEVLAQAGEDTEIIMAELDMSEVEKVRTAIPSLKHDREILLSLFRY
jgi:predicted amidohydrolase